MGSWIHLFSKFTPEALLLEALAIAFGCVAYAAFWILRKRRLGAAKEQVPANLVKTYLNELIFQANTIRNQLFGLLSDAGVQIPQQGLQAEQLAQALKTLQENQTATKTATLPLTTAAISNDPELKNKLNELEKKLTEQAKAMEAVLAEKERLQKELLAAKAGAPTGAQAKGPAAGVDTSDLEKKIQVLEEKLAEYSVIEDDLANLKKLQQENSQLKAALAGKGGEPIPASAPAAAVAAAASTPTPALKEAASAPIPATQTPSIPAAEAAPQPVLAPSAPTPAASATESAPISAPTGNPAFEKVVDAVEAQTTAPTSDAPAPSTDAAASTAAPAAANIPKSDEDLLSEFEKMLDS